VTFAGITMFGFASSRQAKTFFDALVGFHFVRHEFLTKVGIQFVNRGF
jgi:hypothetical protein